MCRLPNRYRKTLYRSRSPPILVFKMTRLSITGVHFTGVLYIKKGSSAEDVPFHMCQSPCYPPKKTSGFYRSIKNILGKASINLQNAPNGNFGSRGNDERPNYYLRSSTGDDPEPLTLSNVLNARRLKTLRHL
jgi:hypothetical protein